MYHHHTTAIASAIRGLCRWYFSSTWNTSQPSKTLPWDKLPDEIVQDIALRMSIPDSKIMSCVCREWDRVINRSQLTLLMMQSAADSQIPWLLQENELSSDVIDFYDLSEGKRYEIVKPKCMWDSFCCGTSNGWLIMIDGSKFYPIMFLWNPITNRIVPLPPLATIPWYIHSLNHGVFDRVAVKNFVKRVEVFYVKDNLVVAAILGFHRQYEVKGRTLVICTPEEDAPWTIFDIHPNLQAYCDILFHNGMLCVVNGQLDDHHDGDYHSGVVEIHRINVLHLEVKLALIRVAFVRCRHLLEQEDDYDSTIFSPGMGFLPLSYYEGWLYLAESIHGELLLIRRNSVYFGFRTVERDVFHIIHNETREMDVQAFKFKFSKGVFTLITWSKSLKDQALFLGTHGASAYTSDMYKNCIWFLPSEHHIRHSLQSKDSGVFDFQEKRFKHCFPSMKASFQSKLGWFTPKLL